MSQPANMTNAPMMGRTELRQLEKRFVAPEFYERPDVADRQGSLARIVSGEIIPRLLRLHTEIVPDAPLIDDLIKSLKPDSADVDALAHIILGDDLDAAADYITVMRDRGLSMGSLYVELLEPTAQYLGKMWDNDECDFVDVTFGVARLKLLLSIFNDTHTLPEFETRRQVLMANAPCNQHVFGAEMIEKLLTAGGWRVDTEFSGEQGEITRAVSENWYAVIGLTAGSDIMVDGLTSVIADVRRASKNPDIGIMVGGPIFTANPALAVEVGADATAPNAPAAVLAAQKLFDIAAKK